MLDYQLFTGYDEPELTEIKASVQYDGACERTKYHKWCLICYGVMTGNKKQYHGDNEHKAL